MNYLYNGMELPPLPSWDKGQYPHAYISKATDTGAVYLYVTNLAMHYNSSLGYIQLTAFSGGTPEYLVFTVDVDAFVPTESYPGKLSNGGVAADSANTDIVWANADVYYLSDKTMLYRSADADPIPITTAPAPDPFWLTMGWLVGRAIAGMRGKKETAEPVAYLYNGVRLPKLPEWDKTVYPYALMYYGATTIVVLCYSKYPMTTDGSKNSGTVRFASGIVVVDQYSINASSETEWNAYGESEGTGTYGGSHKQLIWANHDIFDYDDSSYLHLAASEPVPVYE